MRVVNHRLIGDNGTPVEFRRSPNQSDTIKPEFLVIHYTAGRSASSSINWLTNKDARASAHLVIGQDGATTQLVAFNRKAWHAGSSRWAGREGLNSCSIGIELDNPGRLERRVNGWCSTWGDPVDPANVIEARHKNGGAECGWHTYSGAQLETLQNIAVCLVNHYDLLDVIGHDDIAPGRKSDPGPAFPMARIRSAVIGREQEVVEVFVTVAVLNIRSGPGVEYEKLAFGPLPLGTRLEVIGESGVWRHIDVLDVLDGDSHRTGWVHGHYIESV
ncbi:MAG: N-acetylmuramoyl-L-alanine amidase [Gammaproteobacteria bacterium]|uniref:N-acetylmuramoyl-L-alanine amidase n=1 Tax=Pseudomaricurvus alcaniphilus TaxID=1166482 RepID=UPI001408BF13|nr:N-acetylmuramoyl-L-alanine amidase [Pseudomaricurvus alcaniphilus]MBR9912862.1 N-acetylmuramoyl-L-alanine amidase [Gammaproteobacteria bacterium]NHN36146.1 N-acetylmuramoyl-L-alanine amidase [Pseudomaricurvus alcaniphilus]